MSGVEHFIRRPVMTTLIMTAILLFGILGYRELPVSDLPNVDFPTLLVAAILPGADPDTMAAAVATPLERQFSTIAGLDSMASTSGQGNLQITLQFNLNRDIDAAAQDVQAAIAMAAPQLPREMPTPPSYKKVNPADQPVMFLALSSATLPLSAVDECAQTLIAQRLSMVRGVAQVQVFGSQKYAVRIQLDPRALSSRGIGIDEVATAIQKANVNLPAGMLSGAHQALTLQASGQLTRAAAYRPIIVAYRGGSPVRLEDLGRVLDSVENDKVASWLNNERSVILAVLRQPGTNTVEVVDAIRELFPSFRAQMPAAVQLNVILDRSVSIRASVNEVKFTLVLTVALVVLVIFLFLRSLSATVIPSLALPLSLVGTFAVMYLLGFSIDNLSLMALTLSVGFVVDDAIVVLENIVRHIEQGESVPQAALRGSQEIAFTVISMTISLVAVFIPVLFMGGILGRLLHEFAITIGTAILISGFVSLTLTPMLCSRFLGPRKETAHGRLYTLIERFFGVIFHAYEWSLARVLQHRFATLMASLIIMALTVHLFNAIPKGFLPSEDTGSIYGFTEGAQGISFEAMSQHQQKVSELIRTDPSVSSVSSSIGPSGSNVAGNAGRVFIILKPLAEGRPSAEEILQNLRVRLSGLPGIKVFLQVPPPIRIGGMFTKSLYQLTLLSPDTEVLYRHAPAFEESLAKLPQLVDVTSDLQIKNPQLKINIDRDKASALGVSVERIEEALFNAYAARQVSTIYAPNNQYKVLLELAPEHQADPASLSMLYVRATSDELVPLGTMARFTPGVGPMTVNHAGQLPSVTVSFNLRPGVALSEGLKAVNSVVANTLPASISTTFQGAAQAFAASAKGLGLLLLMAVLVIYLVLGILYESFIHPLTILSGLPSAGLGALITLELFHVDLNIYAFVGLILLVGIVKKNAIMMIDFALDAQRNEGKSPSEAIVEGCLVRFRPILMTTLAALMGTLPIALGFGAGAESRRPLGLAVVGGLLFSQVITLYVTPVYYIYFEQLRLWLGPRFQRGGRDLISTAHPKLLPENTGPGRYSPGGV